MPLKKTAAMSPDEFLHSERSEIYWRLIAGARRSESPTWRKGGELLLKRLQKPGKLPTLNATMNAIFY
jgi:hypothetical protein